MKLHSIFVSKNSVGWIKSFRRALSNNYFTVEIGVDHHDKQNKEKVHKVGPNEYEKGKANKVGLNEYGNAESLDLGKSLSQETCKYVSVEVCMYR